MPFQINHVSLTEEGGFNEGFGDVMGNPTDGLEGIFPIVHLDDAYPNKPIGTGFFISNNGLFATAKHVLVDQNCNLLNSLAGIHIVRRQNRITIREIIKVVLHPIADVAIGFLIDKSFIETGIQTENKCFMLTNRIPEIGEKIGTFAFPRPKYEQNDEFFKGEYICQGNNGVIEEYFPHGRDKIFLPSKCYQTNMLSFGGVSGGPVADINGEVFGINSTGIDGNSISFASSIQDIFDLEVSNCRLPTGEIVDSMSILELSKIDLVGISGVGV